LVLRTVTQKVLLPVQSLDSYCGDAPEQAFYVYRAEDGNITNICEGSFVGSTVKPYRMAAGG
jgi:hypothetical protein